MRIACVIGIGKAGALHERFLRDLSFEVYTVDNRPTSGADFGNVASIPSALASEILIWMIATPTESHLESLNEICLVCEQPRVIVEKPLCSQRDIETFQKVAAASGTAIYVNEIFRVSRAVKRFASLMSSCGEGSLSITFSKRRSALSVPHRFVDHELGVLGYEWYHLLTILSEFIGEERFAEYMNTPLKHKDVRFRATTNAYLEMVAENTRIKSGRMKISLRSDISDSARTIRFIHYRGRAGRLNLLLHDGRCKRLEHKIRFRPFDRSDETIDETWDDNHFRSSVLSGVDALLSEDKADLSSQSMERAVALTTHLGEFAQFLRRR